MPGHCPEDHRQRDSARRHEDRDPDGTTKKEFLDVGFADVKRAEGSGFGLAEEDELVLVGNETENGEST